MAGRELLDGRVPLLSGKDVLVESELLQCYGRELLDGREHLLRGKDVLEGSELLEGNKLLSLIVLLDVGGGSSGTE